MNKTKDIFVYQTAHPSELRLNLHYIKPVWLYKISACFATAWPGACSLYVCTTISMSILQSLCKCCNLFVNAAISMSILQSLCLYYNLCVYTTISMYILQYLWLQTLNFRSVFSSVTIFCFSLLLSFLSKTTAAVVLNGTGRQQCVYF